MSQRVDLDIIVDLYRRFGDDLYRVRESQRALYRTYVLPETLGHNIVWRGMRASARFFKIPSRVLHSLRPQLDDIEAEITYLLVRLRKPGHVVEISPSAGWSTSWILNALKDNGKGMLSSFDVIDDSTRILPSVLTSGRWSFWKGDVRKNVDHLPSSIEYLFMDSDHSAEFARWYTHAILEKLQPGTVVSVHDVFHTSDPCSHDREGGVVTEWLTKNGKEWFTASAARSPRNFQEISRVRHDLGLDDLIHMSQTNSMLFFVM